MALRTGFVTISNDPYAYLENAGNNTVSVAWGINSIGNGTFSLFVSPNPGASPTNSYQQMTVDPVHNNIDFYPDAGVFTIHGIAGITSLTNYAVICTGGSGNLTSVASLGTVGQVLTSQGPGELPVWESAGGENMNYTAVNHAASPYTASATDYYMGVDASGGIVTINLPNAPATGRVFVVKDNTGSASTNNITVTTVGGSVNLDGATSFVMDTAYQAAEFIFNGTAYEVF